MHTTFVAGCGKLHLPLSSLHKMPTEFAGIYAPVISLWGGGGGGGGGRGRYGAPI